MRDRAAIAGIGYTEFSKDSGVSTLALGLRAVTAALEDAGIPLAELDGIATHRVGDSALPGTLAQSLGVRDLRFFVDQFGGGSCSHSIVGQAALAAACEDVGQPLSDLLYARVDMVEHGGQWLISELELLEPSLFLMQSPVALTRFVGAIAARCR